MSASTEADPQELVEVLYGAEEEEEEDLDMELYVDTGNGVMVNYDDYKQSQADILEAEEPSVRPTEVEEVYHDADDEEYLKDEEHQDSGKKTVQENRGVDADENDMINIEKEIKWKGDIELMEREDDEAIRKLDVDDDIEEEILWEGYIELEEGEEDDAIRKLIIDNNMEEEINWDGEIELEETEEDEEIRKLDMDETLCRSEMDEEARRTMLASISPISCAAPERVSRVSRGRARSKGDWVRGNPLQEVFLQNDDIPLTIKAGIRQTMQSRSTSQQKHSMKLSKDNEDLKRFDLNESFEWKPSASWNGEREKFKPQEVGPTSNFANAYEALHAIWHDIMPHIVKETNRHAQRLAAERPAFAKSWVDTNVHEIWSLFAFWIMLGIIRMPSIKSCFTTIPILRTDVFQRLFTQSRYWVVNSAFHLSEGKDPNNPLHPLGLLVPYLNTKFQELYRLEQELSIDESLTLWKGPVSFKQYIKGKTAQYGIKTYQLCESATGYMWSFYIYVGRTTGDQISIPSSAAAVMKLVRPLLGLGHTLFMDRYFNSPTLARWLKKQNTDCVGTLLPTKKHVPLEVQRCPLDEGQFIARASESVMVIALLDRNRRVTVLSTYHGVSQTKKEAKPAQSSQYKLKLIDDYNHWMGGVDKMDQMLAAYLVERKQCLKWNLKMFKRLLNVSIQNARILVEKSHGKKIDSLTFRLALIQGILEKHVPLVPGRRKRSPNTNAPHSYNNFPDNRLTERHFPRKIPITDEARETVVHKCNLGRRYCVWCKNKKKKRTKTMWDCAQCKLPLCMPKCFTEFHTIP